MSWQKSDSVCFNIFTFLQLRGQYPDTMKFSDAGNLKVSQLAFFPANGSDAMIKQRALELAMYLDGKMMAAGAQYVAGSDSGKATSAMSAWLAVGANLVSGLDLTDQHYSI